MLHKLPLIIITVLIFSAQAQEAIVLPIDLIELLGELDDEDQDNLDAAMTYAEDKEKTEDKLDNTDIEAKQ